MTTTVVRYANRFLRLPRGVERQNRQTSCRTVRWRGAQYVVMTYDVYTVRPDAPFEQLGTLAGYGVQVDGPYGTYVRVVEDEVKAVVAAKHAQILAAMGAR